MAGFGTPEPSDRGAGATARDGNGTPEPSDRGAGAGTRDGAAPIANVRARRTRTATDFLRKLAAVLLVLAGATIGLWGLGATVDGAPPGRPWGALMMAAMPVAILAALRITPEGGTSGYCDQNI